jgi:uncharacterized paraquat-inducible protein A
MNQSVQHANLIQCANCGAIYGAPRDASAQYYCIRCGNRSFVPVAPGTSDSYAQAGLAALGALLGFVVGGPPAAVAGALLGYFAGESK